MPDIIPPIPIDAHFSAYNWQDWYQKVRRAINDPTAGSITWSAINFTGSTLADIATKPHSALTGLTTGDPHTQYQLRTEKDAPGGYMGINVSGRINIGMDATDDVIIDDATQGLVLKDTQGTPHYWRITIDNTGGLVITDLGTTKP